MVWEFYFLLLTASVLLILCYCCYPFSFLIGSSSKSCLHFSSVQFSSARHFIPLWFTVATEMSLGVSVMMSQWWCFTETSLNICGIFWFWYSLKCYWTYSLFVGAFLSWCECKLFFFKTILGFVRGNYFEDYFSCEGTRVQTFKQSKCDI